MNFSYLLFVVFLIAFVQSEEGDLHCGGEWQFMNEYLNPAQMDFDYPPIHGGRYPEAQKFESYLLHQADTHQPKRTAKTNITLIYNETIMNQPKYQTLKNTLEAAKKVWEDVLEDGLQLEVGINLVNETQPYLGVTTSILIVLPYSIVQYAHENEAINNNDVWKSFKNTLKFHELFNFPPDTLWNDQLTVTPAELLLLWGRSTYETYELDKDPTTIHINDGYLSLFDLDPYDPTPDNLYDLFSVVVHEFGHVFGFGSGIDDIDFGVNENKTTGPYPLFSLDLFRFVNSSETDLVSGIRQADPSTTSHWYSDSEIHAQMASGSYSGEYQASHWTFDNTTVLGLMSPVLFRGKQMGFSPNDISAFEHLGYHMNDQVPSVQSYILATDFTNVTVQGFWIQDSKKVYCRFNQDDSTNVKPLDRSSQNRYREVTCQIPKSLRVEGSKLMVELSNDKGKTWSNSLLIYIEKRPVATSWKLNGKQTKITITGTNFSPESFCEFLYSIRVPGDVSNKKTQLSCQVNSTIPLTGSTARVRVWQHTQGSNWLNLTMSATTTTTTSSSSS